MCVGLESKPFLRTGGRYSAICGKSLSCTFYHNLNIMIREDFKTVEELPIDFDGRGSTNGFHYHQVYRKDGWYIYKVTRTYDNGYTKEFFEFFKERVVKTSVYGDNGWEQVEGLGKIAYPCDMEFGSIAWTLPTFDGCLMKIAEKSSN